MLLSCKWRGSHYFHLRDVVCHLIGWLIGFISKQDASSQMVMAPHPTFLLRFSDTQTGAVSIGFVCDDDDGKGKFISVVNNKSYLKLISFVWCSCLRQLHLFFSVNYSLQILNLNYFSLNHFSFLQCRFIFHHFL